MSLWELIQYWLGFGIFANSFGAARSSQWAGVRAAHLAKEPACVACGGTSKLNVHHIKPFHIHPELELDPANLITLCNGSSGTIACHIRFGHWDNFKDKWNPDVRAEAALWRARFGRADMSGVPGVDAADVHSGDVDVTQ